MTKQRMAMRSNFPWSDFKKPGTPELSSSSSTSTALSPKNFEKRAHPTHQKSFSWFNLSLKYYNSMENITGKRSDPFIKIINIAQKRASTVNVIRYCVK